MLNKTTNIMLTPAQITEIFCLVDDFCLQIDDFISQDRFSMDFIELESVDYSKFSMCPSEIITLLICYQHSGFRSLKTFYLDFAIPYLSSYFPGLPSCSRFVELQAMCLFHNFLFTKFCCPGKCDGISFIDSFKLAICHNKRIHQNKVFAHTAQRGHTSMGFFFGFKGHIVVNSNCEIIDFQLTKGNVADNDENLLHSLCRNVYGKVYGDKGYILNPEKFESLLNKGIQIVSKIRNNMKNRLMDLNDKFMLKRRSIVETVIDQLKNICHIEHTRHRSPINFFNNFLSVIAAYCFKSEKPKLRTQKTKYNNFNPLQLSLDL